ncbi:phosphatidate cytidylyltransferase [Magnetospirillum sp. J10]|uniref:Phosphatidate cytidylyltransferase n=1 Tax=Magnetospirillum sulfuroxidans TaxID=611300 RepID=A0ABS5I866_9PROT|nr:phosphatidate cytidylyltransferase [Magnetospirillum sulfuroxidans]
MLRTRILSALVMAPPALAAVWYGGWAFAMLVAVAAAIMCWEWHGMVVKRFPVAGWVAAFGCAIATLLALHSPSLAVLLVVAAAIASAAMAPLAGERPRLWAGMGALYAGLPSVALVWLRQEPQTGLITVIWLFLLVWATDIGAYAAGRTIGGPLLMPAVSPKKTWAGLLGGMVSAMVAGAGIVWLSGVSTLPALIIGSAVLAVIAQAGDLLESWVKRRCDVKDSSAIIPGHGGVLDRVDGLLAAAVAVALAALASGQAVLLWS